MVVTAESVQEQGLSAGPGETAAPAGHGEAVEAVRRRKRARPDAGTEFPGVPRRQRRPGSGEYGAQIWDPLQRNNVWLGTFGTIEDAAKAYDAASVELHGAAAQTNFKILEAVESSASVMEVKESAQEQGLSARNFEIAEEHRNGVGAVERRKKKAVKKDAPRSRTGFWGVRWTPSGRYGAQIKHSDGKDRWLGTFDTAEEAARAYDAVSVELRGAAAQTNFEIPTAVRSSASVTVVKKESAQEQGLSADSFEIAEEHRDVVEVVEGGKEKASPDARTEFRGGWWRPSGKYLGTFVTAEDGAAVKLPCVKKVTCRPRSRTGFRGVRWQQRSGNYAAEIVSQKVRRWLGTFDTAQDAARAYDAAAIKLHGAAAKTNFASPAAVRSSVSVTEVKESAQEQGLGPGNFEIAEEHRHRDDIEAVEKRKEKASPDARTEAFVAADAAKFPCVKKATCRRDSGTGFRGVRLQPSGKYAATIKRNKVRRWLGTFDTAGEAARAYDAAAIKLHDDAAKANFKSPAVPIADDINPGHEQMIGLKQAPVAAMVNSNVEVWRSAVARSDSRSGFRGVRLYREGGSSYIAQIREPGRPTTRLNLGIFDKVEDAARAYDAAALRLYGPAAKTNFEQPHTGAAADDDEESVLDLLNNFRYRCAARPSL